jgi:hypothetical protein
MRHPRGTWPSRSPLSRRGTQHVLPSCFEDISAPRDTERQLRALGDVPIKFNNCGTQFCRWPNWEN